MTVLAQIIWQIPKAVALAYAPTFVRSFIVSKFGKLDNTRPRDVDAQNASLPKHMQDLAVRLKSAHYNQLETLPIFIGGVALGVAVQVPHHTLLRISSYYLKSRLAYVLAYAAPQVAGGALRSVSFMASMTSAILLYASAANFVNNAQ